jgi:hypothetical protein
MIKRCPLCGSKAELDFLDTPRGHWVIECINSECGVAVIGERVPHDIEGEDPGRDTMIDRWEALPREKGAAKLRAALGSIASCTSYHEGDVVDIARKALMGD